MSGILPERTNGTSDPELLNAPGPSSPIQSPNAAIPRSSLDDAEPDPSQLKHELAVARQEKEVLGNQYRNLLGKLTAMRQSLGEKLREDAVGLPVLHFWHY